MERGEGGEKMNVLNLYAGIGGNRKLWPKECQVTAIELNPQIAATYQKFFPQDKVITTDAHYYLLKHFEKFDFIWSSPPCPSHSRIRNIAGVGAGQNKPIYPDMKLYEEIIFLNQVFHTSGTKFKGKWVVENVASYYEPLIKPANVGLHYFWANFHITPFKTKTRLVRETTKKMSEKIGIDLNEIKDISLRKDTLLRNCVEPELGLHVFNCAFKGKQTNLNEAVT